MDKLFPAYHLPVGWEETLRRAIFDRMERFEQEDGTSSYSFIGTEQLLEVWTSFFNARKDVGTDASVLGSWQHVLKPASEKSLLKIASILVLARWSSWHKLAEIFATGNRWDSDLPFELSELRDEDFLGPSVGKKFFSLQPTCLSVTIEQGKDLVFTEQFRLPLTSRSKGTAVGSFGYGAVRQTKSSEEQWLARICLPFIDRTRPLEALNRMKLTSSWHQNIMMHFGTVTIGPHLSIFVEWANESLHDLFYKLGVSEDHRRPNRMLAEARDLVAAIEFVHYSFESGTRRLEGNLNNLSPDSIVVRPKKTADDPIGRWMIVDIDFSLEPNDFNHPDDITHRYRDFVQPPEEEEAWGQTRQKSSQAGDVWRLGCILSLVLAFAIGGSEAVEAFRLVIAEDDARQDRGHVYGYDYSGEVTRRVLKPSVQAWLAAVDAGMSLDWVAGIIQVIRMCLQIESHQRCNTRDMQERLGDVVRLCREHPWQGTKVFGVDGISQSAILRKKAPALFSGPFYPPTPPSNPGNGSASLETLSDDAGERPRLPREKVPPITFSGFLDVSADSETRTTTPKALGLEEDLMRRSAVPATPDIEGGSEEPDPAVSQVTNLQLEDNTRLDPSVTSEPQSGHGHDAVTVGLEDPRSRAFMTGRVGSQNSTIASQIFAPVEKVISLLLAFDLQLKPLHEEALSEMEATHFVDNYCRLLKTFCVHLLQKASFVSASGRVERELIRLLDNHACRIRIALNIVEIIKLQSEVTGNENLEQSLMSWLTDRKDSIDLNDEPDPDAIKHGAEPDDSEHLEAANITVMQEYLLQGRPFQILLFNIHIFLLPKTFSSLTRILMTMPKEKVWITEETNYAPLNTVKIIMEKFSGEQWHWWPLRPPLHPLQQGQVRINWQCHCDTHLWAEVAKPLAERYIFLLGSEHHQRNQTHLCATRKENRPKTRTRSFLRFALPAFLAYTLVNAVNLPQSLAKAKAKDPAPGASYVVSVVPHNNFLYTFLKYVFLLYIGVLSGSFFIGFMEGYFLFRLSRAISKIGNGFLDPLLTHQHEYGSDSKWQLSEDWALAKGLDPSGTEPSRVKITPSPSGTNQAAGTSGNQAPSGTQSSSSGVTGPSHAPAGALSQGSVSSPAGPGIQAMAPGGAAPALGHSQQNFQATASLVRTGLFVFFVVKGARRTLELAEINAKKHKDDGPFFKELQTQYKELRGFWRRWFSVWRLKHCNFVKFQKIRANRFLYHKDEIPDDPAYEYSPKPPDDVPPITPHEFELALDHCGDRCLWSLLHDCVEPPIGLYALHRIPKRNSTLHRTTDDPEFAWGIQAKHIPSFIRILAYHVLIISGTFGFWIWWQIRHPQDLSNASVPASVLVALVSLFWALSAVPKTLREPV